MAKIYKISFYATDYVDYYDEDIRGLLMDMGRNLDGLWMLTSHLKIKESKKFEWDDSLKINKTHATEEDLEEYFK